MADFHRFTRDLIALRRRHPALRADPIAVYATDHANRVLAFNRWVPGAGRDVVVVASLGESTFYDHATRSASRGPATGTRSSTATSTTTSRTRGSQGNPGGDHGRRAADARPAAVGADHDPGQQPAGVRARSRR